MQGGHAWHSTNSKLLSAGDLGDNNEMKLSLRYFLIISILLGAVAIPVGWRSYQNWKAREIERLEKEKAAEIDRLKREEFDLLVELIKTIGVPPSADMSKLEKRRSAIEDLMRETLEVEQSDTRRNQ